jgi:hypothetical protein
MARIVFTLEDGVEIESELDSDVITIGRHPDSIIVLPSGSVSSHHATIKRRGTDFYVQDLGTTNGTKLNGVDVEEAKLDDGDKITFGDVRGIVHLREPVVEARLPPARTPDIVPPSAPPIPMLKVSKRRLAADKRARIQYKESTGCASFLIFLVLMLLAFIIGLHVRHGKETGGFLLQDLVKKFSERASENLEQAPPSTSERKEEKPPGKKMQMPTLQPPTGAPSNN